jgi:hypothetical protein
MDDELNSPALSFTERCKVVGVAIAFYAIFTALMAMAVLYGEPLSDFHKYPLDPRGWFIVRLTDGSVVREATLWDMLKAKYMVVLFLAGYVTIILVSLYAVLLGVRGKRNALTKWVLAELSRAKR